VQQLTEIQFMCGENVTMRRLFGFVRSAAACGDSNPSLPQSSAYPPTGGGEAFGSPSFATIHTWPELRTASDTCSL
jgi:hypothetical protein